MTNGIGDTFAGTARIIDIRRGGMGVVYICEGTVGGLQGVFAIKTYAEIEQRIKGSVAGEVLCGARDSLQRRFADEAMIHLDLPLHPNIVATYGIHNNYGTPFLIMEYVDGSSLREMIDLGPLNLTTAMDYAGQLLVGLKFAFDECQLLHRDIKPENILLTRDGILKVADFGLARTIVEELVNQAGASNEKGTLASLGEILGTLPYMSPEQAFAPDQITVRSDIYSFGVVLFEMLTGVRPFMVNTFDQMLDLLARKIPPRLSTLRKDVPDGLSVLVARCLSKSPHERFAGYDEILDQLDSLHFPRRRTQPAQLIGATALYRKAMGLINLGKDREALAHLKQHLSGEPDGDLLFAAGTAQGNLNIHDEAIVTLNRALELGSSNRRQLLFNRGNSLLALKRHAEAVASYHAALDFDPGYAKPWGGIAQANLDVSDYASALKHCDRAIALDAADPNFWTLKALAYFKLAQTHSASKALAKARELGSTDPSVLRNLAVIYLEMGQVNEAANVIEARLHLLPSVTAEVIQEALATVAKIEDETAVRRIVSALVKAAPESFVWDDLKMPFLTAPRVYALLEAGNLDAAEKLIREHSLESPDDMQILVVQAELFRQRRDPDAALKVLRRASQIRLNDPVPWHNSSRIYVDLSRFEEALAAIDESIERGGGPEGSYALRACILQQLERHEAALQACELALASTPGDLSVLKCKGSSLHALKRNAEAVLWFDEALKLYPQNTALLAAQWHCYLSLHQYGAALACSERILEIAPKDAVAWYHKGLVLAHLSDYPQALQCNLHAVALRDDLYVAHTIIGVIHLLNEDYVQAIIRLDRALELSPSFTTAKTNRVLAEIRRNIKALVSQNPKLKEEDLVEGFEAEARSRGINISLDLTRIRFLEVSDADFASIADPTEAPKPTAASTFDREKSTNLPLNKDTYLGRNMANVPTSQHTKLRERAVELAEAGAHDQAVMLLRQLVHTLPSDCESWHVLATCLDALGQQEEALACYNHAIQALPPGVESPESYNGKGEVLRKLGRFADAIPLFDKVLEHLPDHEFALNNRGLCLKGLGRIDEARASFKLALTSHPDSWRALGNLAQMEANNGNSIAALECCQRLRNLSDQHLTIHIMLALVYSRLGKPEDLQTELEYVRSEQPDHPIFDALANPLSLAGKQIRRNSDFHIARLPVVARDSGKPYLVELAEQCSQRVRVLGKPITTEVPDVGGRMIFSNQLNTFQVLKVSFALHLIHVDQDRIDVESHVIDTRPGGRIVHFVTRGKGEAEMTVMMGEILAVVEIEAPDHLWSRSFLKRLNEIQFIGDTFLHCPINPILALDQWLREGSTVKWGAVGFVYQNGSLSPRDGVSLCFYLVDGIRYPLFHLADEKSVAAIQTYCDELIRDENRISELTPAELEEKIRSDTLSKLVDHQVFMYYLSGKTAMEMLKTTNHSV